jgi:protein-L-isoaspartate(D-aspartate) O-methyltransferase
VPDTLLEQLAIGGRMVIPVGEGETQTMVLLVRKDEKTFQRSEMGVFRFVPMLEDKNGGGF